MIVENPKMIFTDGLGKVEPEIVVLAGQSIEEVKDLLNEDPVFFKDREVECGVKQQTDQVEKAKECLNKASKVKLTFDDASGDYAPHVRDINLEYGRKEIKKDFNLFHQWRRLASVGEVCIDQRICLPDDLGPTQELMSNILIKINSKFPNLKATWEEEWNPCLLIQGCKTQISMMSISSANTGLKNLVDEPTAHHIISDIILKKLESLFI